MPTHTPLANPAGEEKKDEKKKNGKKGTARRKGGDIFSIFDIIPIIRRRKKMFEDSFGEPEEGRNATGRA